MISGILSGLTFLLAANFIALVWAILLWVSGFGRSPWGIATVVHGLVSLLSILFLIRGYLGVQLGHLAAGPIAHVICGLAMIGITLFLYQKWDKYERNKSAEFAAHVARQIEREEHL